MQHWSGENNEGPGGVYPEDEKSDLFATAKTLRDEINSV